MILDRTGAPGRDARCAVRVTRTGEPCRHCRAGGVVREDDLRAAGIQPPGQALEKLVVAAQP